jgi:hypothetical protein
MQEPLDFDLAQGAISLRVILGANRSVRSVTKTLKASAAQFERGRNADGGTGESANPFGQAKTYEEESPARPRLSGVHEAGDS